ncbi:hypothetical protein ACFSC4_22160 [Deinococcus malanensis]|uniref:hypothetical protein n=1 Tax=Deinococcus malanensis TaxID=1706855 RepID=UPI00363CB77E
MRRASRDLGRNLNNVSSLDEFVTNRLDSITTALSGEQFVTRLQRQGLSAAEAQTTAQAISKRATEVRQQAEEAAAATERIARTTASTAAWGFLLALGLILGAATLGGGKGRTCPAAAQS